METDRLGRFWIYIWLVLGLVAAVCFSTDPIEVKMVQSDHPQVLQCPSGTVLVPLTVFYGVPNTSCQLHSAIKTVLDNCYSAQQCEMDLSYFPDPCDDVEKSEAELSISFVCVEASNIVNICAPPAQLPSTFFLVTPNFPSKYPANQDCELDFQPVDSPQVKLNIIYMDLKKRTTAGCYDSVYIEDPDLIATRNQYCGSTVNPTTGINNDWPLEVILDKARFTFLTDGVKHKTGFLIWLTGVGDEDDSAASTQLPTAESSPSTTEAVAYDEVLDEDDVDDDLDGEFIQVSTAEAPSTTAVATATPSSTVVSTQTKKKKVPTATLR